MSSPTFIGRRSELDRFEASLTRARGGELALVEVAGEGGHRQDPFPRRGSRSSAANRRAGPCRRLRLAGRIRPPIRPVRRSDPSAPSRTGFAELTELAATLWSDQNSGSLGPQRHRRALRRRARAAPSGGRPRSVGTRARGPSSGGPLDARTDRVPRAEPHRRPRRPRPEPPDVRRRPGSPDSDGCCRSSSGVAVSSVSSSRGSIERSSPRRSMRSSVCTRRAGLSSASTSGQMATRSSSKNCSRQVPMPVGSGARSATCSSCGSTPSIPGVKDVVRACAVGGAHATVGSLAALTGDDDALADLRRAVEASVLVPLEQPGTDVFDFRHALVREAVYAELLPAERRRLHRSFAGILAKEQPADSRASHAAALAYHWHQADDLPKAFDASIVAGFAADDLYAIADAGANFQRAAALWDQIDDAASRSPLEPRGSAAARGGWWRGRAHGSDRPHASGRRPGRSGGRSIARRLRALLPERLCLWAGWTISPLSRSAARRSVSSPAIPRRSRGHGHSSATHRRSRISIAMRSRPSCAWQRSTLPNDRMPGSRRRSLRPGPSPIEHRPVSPSVRAALLGPPSSTRWAASGCARRPRGGRELLSQARRSLANTATSRGSTNHSPSRRCCSTKPVASRMRYAPAWPPVSTGSATATGASSGRALLRCGRELSPRPMGRGDPKARVGALVAGGSLPTSGVPPRTEVQAAIEAARGDFAPASARLERLVPLLDRALCAGRIASATARSRSSHSGRADALRARATICWIHRSGFVDPPDGWVGDLGSVCALGLRAEADIALRARAFRDEPAVADARRSRRCLDRTDARTRDGGGAPAGHLPAAGRRRLAILAAEYARLLDQADEADRWTAAATAWDELGMPYPAAYARWREASWLIAHHEEPARAKATSSPRSGPRSSWAPRPSGARSNAWPSTGASRSGATV